MIIITEDNLQQIKNNISSVKDIENSIICADVLQGLSLIPDNTVSLVFTSPPYNVDIPYGNHKDIMPWAVYLEWLKKIWIECKRVLRPGGRLGINIDLIFNRQEDKDKEYLRQTHVYFGNQMKEIGMLPFTEIAWYKHQVAGRKTAWGSYCSNSCPIVRRQHEYIYVYCKEKWSLEGDSELSDMTVEEFNEYTMSTWFVPPDTSKKAGHPAKFPEKLPERMIKLFTYRGDLVLDVFNGSGTTSSMAAYLGRRWIGIDNYKVYCDYAETRTNNAKQEFDMQEQMTPYIPRSIRLKKRYKKQR